MPHSESTQDQKASLAQRDGYCVKEDAALVAALAAGDESVLREIISRHGGIVRQICRRICFDETEVNELVSEVFFELWRRADSFDPDRGTVRSFLLTMARSRAIDRRRASVSRQKMHTRFAEKVKEQFQTAVSQTETGSEILQQERAHEVRLALSNLPENQQVPIELAFFDGLTHEEVAEHLDAPLGTIKSRIRTGLIQLRRILQRSICSEDH